MHHYRPIAVFSLLASLVVGTFAGREAHGRWLFWKDAVRWEYVVLEHLDRPLHGETGAGARSAVLVEILEDGKMTQKAEIAVRDLSEYPIGGRLSWYYNQRRSEWPERAEFFSYWGTTCAWSFAAVVLVATGAASLARSRKENLGKRPPGVPGKVPPAAAEPGALNL